ncbi:probable glucan 1,3-beta-glucosidase A isoform X2 [Phragmites australis]|uniref:probable glucan 1,3-beta-glucosidase A isoform X2 n=1 Tax=Phragmites australis TaxID=29695 RepID=UPI002D782B5A|nr:probable glucan 1,3-beta-glucosidase A isoform X2 [Phragmites australis]
MPALCSFASPSMFGMNFAMRKLASPASSVPAHTGCSTNCPREMRLPHASLLIVGVLSAFQISHSSTDDDFSKVRAVNLGGWLVVEGWIKPSLFDGIPNRDMLDGTQVQLKSVGLQKYVSAGSGGGGSVTVNQDVASSWETFKLWRISTSIFQFRCFKGQFLTASDGDVISATADSPGDLETFYIERNNTMLHIKLLNGSYLQVTNDSLLTSNYPSQPGWDDVMATFELTIVANNLHGDYQLANGYGSEQAKAVLTEHRKSFVTGSDFYFLSQNGINAVRIPVGWWIAYDPDPPAPFIGGSLDALDRAFYWAQIYGLKGIIDLHAAPGSQNGIEHSASRDGSVDWPSEDNIEKTLDVIKFLAQRYANNPCLLGIELLNEPSAAAVPLDTLVSYYKTGYKIVRSYSDTAYVIFCQRIGNADPMELYQADLGPTNTVVDLHYYNLFDPYFEKLNATENIQFIYKNRMPQVQTLNHANGPLVFIGEWVNEWNVTDASQIQYQLFGKAQLEVYGEASFGWSYWTIKCNSVHWDYEWNIRNRYLIGGSPFDSPNYILLVAGCLMYLLFIVT